MTKTEFKIGDLVVLTNGMYVKIVSIDTDKYTVSDITSHTKSFYADPAYIEHVLTTDMNKELFLSLPANYNTAKLFAYLMHEAEKHEEKTGSYIKDFWLNMVAYLIFELDNEVPTVEKAYKAFKESNKSALDIFDKQ